MKAIRMTKHASTIIAACLALALGACQNKSHQAAKQDAQEHWGRVRAGVKLQLARQQFASASFEASVVTSSEVLGLDPAQTEAYLLLARSYLELGRLPEASNALDAAEQRKLSSPALTYTRGVLMERKDRWDEALPFYQAARAQDPAQIDYLIAEAECLVALHRVDEAVALVEEQRDHFGFDPSLSMLSGHLSMMTGDRDAAVKWYGQAATALPDSADAAEAYGLALFAGRRYMEAAAVLRPLVEKDQASSAGGAVFRALAACEMQAGRPEPARQLLLGHTERFPSDGEALLLLAKASLMTDDEMTALRCVHQVQQLDPGNAEAWLVRATLQFKRRDLTAAEASLGHVLARRPDDVDALCMLGEVQSAQGHGDAARLRFRRALEIDPQCAWATREIANGE